MESKGWSVMKRAKTAKEMALTSHRLVADGNYAITAEGDHYVWDRRYEQWSLWKRAERREEILSSYEAAQNVIDAGGL